LLRYRNEGQNATLGSVNVDGYYEWAHCGHGDIATIVEFAKIRSRRYSSWKPCRTLSHEGGDSDPRSNGTRGQGDNYKCEITIYRSPRSSILDFVFYARARKMARSQRQVFDNNDPVQWLEHNVESTRVPSICASRGPFPVRGLV